MYNLNLKIPNRQYWPTIRTIKATGTKKVAIFPINLIKNVNDAEQKPVGIRGDKFLHYSQGYRRHVWDIAERKNNIKVQVPILRRVNYTGSDDLSFKILHRLCGYHLGI